ncbi:hypothetical protein [Streptomyces fructofermentans]|nr:hypothetical protein [Streptomyces fructofermentans]
MALSFHGTRRYVAACVLTATVGATTWALADARARNPEPRPHRPPSPAALAEQGLRPPIYAQLYAWTRSGEQIATAQQQVLVSCMAERGFTIEPAPVAKAGDAAVSRPTPFGLETLEEIGADSQRQAPPEQPQGEAFNRALYGRPGHEISVKGKLLKVSMPAGGCQAEAEKHMLGDGRVRWTELRMQLNEGEQTAFRWLKRDSHFREANEGWRQCMLTNRVQAKDPLDLIRALPPDTDIRTHPATKADVHCKQETGYLRTAYARLAVMQQRWLDDHPDVLKDRTALRDRQLTIARQVLRGRIG